MSLDQLNSDVPQHVELRAFSLLTDRDIADLEALARQADDHTITSASEAAMSLRVIHGMIQKAKDINERIGWLPTDQEMQRWKRAIENSHRSLQEIETVCERLVAS